MKHKIIFDVFGVLFSSGFASSAEQLCEHLDRPQKEVEPVYERWEIPFDLGSVSEKRFWELVQKDLGTNIDWEILNNVVKNRYNQIEGSINLLKKYSNLTECYLLSNTRKEWFEYLDSIYKITKHVKYSFLSYEMKLLKPNIEIFWKVLRKIGIDPQYIIFIDDSIENIRTAMLTGMQTHHFNDALKTERFIKNVIRVS